MDPQPPGSPSQPLPQHSGEPSHAESQHSREPSHAGSNFSEHNPLSGDNPPPFPQPPKKPKAVALHGWQRTVGVDEDFDPTIPVCLGAPGTGLFTAKVGGGGGQSAGNTLGGGSALGVGAVVDLGNARVTRADKKEAKSLRLQPALPDAAPLPYPRVTAVDSGSESSCSSAADTDDDGEGDGGDDPARQLGQKERQALFETQSSSASSDMSFLVNATSGSFLGGRQTFGRKIDPRIPATVGEERLHNSLAQYFGKSRRNVTSGDVAGGGVEESKGGDSRPSAGAAAAVTAAGTTGGDKEPLVPQDGAGSSSSPASGKQASAATPGGDGDTVGTALSASGGSASTMNTSTSAASVALAVQHQHRRGGSSTRNGGKEGDRSGAGETMAGAEESKKREASSRLGRTGKAAMLEEGRLAKGASMNGSEGGVDPGRRAPTCGCLRSWPWKLLSGVATLMGVVAVVTVIVIATGGDSSGDTGRRLFSPQLLSLPPGVAAHNADGFGRHRGGDGVGADGDVFRAGPLSHSGRMLRSSIHDGEGISAASAASGGGGVNSPKTDLAEAVFRGAASGVAAADAGEDSGASAGEAAAGVSRRAKEPPGRAAGVVRGTGKRGRRESRRRIERA